MRIYHILECSPAQRASPRQGHPRPKRGHRRPIRGNPGNLKPRLAMPRSFWGVAILLRILCFRSPFLTFLAVRGIVDFNRPLSPLLWKFGGQSISIAPITPFYHDVGFLPALGPTSVSADCCINCLSSRNTK